MWTVVDISREHHGCRSWQTYRRVPIVREVYDLAGLGRSIRALRRAKGWTQAELAAWLGVNRQTVIALERGGPVSVSVAVRAVSLLGGKLIVAPKESIISEGEGDS
jgi:DNA-binding XRE family transcriptional regulator